MLLLSFRAQAQLAPLARLAGVGASTAVGSAAGKQQQQETRFVLPATFGTHPLAQQRIPATKLLEPDKGGTEMQATGQLLAGRYTAPQADATALLLSLTQEQEFSRLRTNLETFNPVWNTSPYFAEMNFYQQHDASRHRLARPAATH